MADQSKPYELQVLEILLAPGYSRSKLLGLVEDAENPQAEYTNYGFYISIENSAIGPERRVYSNPALIGRWDDKDAGFVVILEDNHLTLEIPPWDGESLPATFRVGDIQIIGAAARNRA